MTFTDIRLRSARGASSRLFAVRRYRRTPVKPDDRWAKRRIGIVWALLILNALTFFKGVSFLPIPGIVGKMVTQGSLPLALLLAMSVNRKLIIRPNVFMCLLSALIFGAIITSFQPQHLGTVYRTFRLTEFIAVLWLLTPWWGRRDLLLLRCHLKTISVLLCTVLLGLFISPGKALTEGRLTGVVWPVPPTQVAHYAAVTTGAVLLLWFCGRMRGRFVIVIVIAELVILILTHTRTALLGLIVGLIVAGLSLVKTNTRIRRVYMTAGVLAAVAGTTMSAYILNWAARGEGTKQLTDLTGRTLVWSQILSFPRNKFQEIFGFGLSNSSFNGLPIDSNWLAAYDELGLFGVCVCVAVLVFLLVNAYFQPRGLERALALFLVVYAIIASLTETGITDVSPYMLEVTLAASMMVPYAVPSGARGWRPTRAAVAAVKPAAEKISPAVAETKPIELTPKQLPGQPPARVVLTVIKLTVSGVSR